MTAVFTAAIDCGTSKTKILSIGQDEKLNLDVTASEVIPISSKHYPKAAVGNTDPVQSGVVEFDNNCYRFGLAAIASKAEAPVEKLKFEVSIPKILAFIGAASQKYDFPNGSSLNIGTVLPWIEYCDRDILEEKVREYLADFTFCGQKKSFKCNIFRCIPEGGGVLLQGRQAGSDFSHLSGVVLGLGYRDCSILYIQGGGITDGKSEKLGFYHFCQLLGEQIGYSNYRKLAEIVCQAGHNLNSYRLNPLVNTVSKSYRSAKFTKIKKLIRECKQEYLEVLFNWLEPKLDQKDIDEIIVSGGTANYFRKDLSNRFKKMGVPKILWCDGLESRIRSSFTPQIEQYSLHYRLADVYGLFFYLYGLAQKG